MSIAISVIVPVYNVEAYLPRCIDSILGQVYQPLEIILVDDGSTDSSPEICEEYRQKYEIIRVVHKENGGLSSARNYGLDICKGEFVSFVDSDDWIEADMYQEFVKRIQMDHSDIVIGRRNRIDENGNIRLEPYRRYPEKTCFDKMTGLSYLMSFCGFDMSVCDKLFRRDIIGSIRFPFGKKCEDSFTTYRFFAKAERISYLDAPFYNYCYRENSISRDCVVNEGVIEATCEQRDFILRNYPSLRLEADTSYGFSLLSVYNEYIKRNQTWNEVGHYQGEMRTVLKSVLKNDRISHAKKFQAILFAYSAPMYKRLLPMVWAMRL